MKLSQTPMQSTTSDFRVIQYARGPAVLKDIINYGSIEDVTRRNINFYIEKMCKVFAERNIYLKVGPDAKLHFVPKHEYSAWYKSSETEIATAAMIDNKYRVILDKLHRGIESYVNSIATGYLSVRNHRDFKAIEAQERQGRPAQYTMTGMLVFLSFVSIFCVRELLKYWDKPHELQDMRGLQLITIESITIFTMLWLWQRPLPDYNLQKFQLASTILPEKHCSPYSYPEITYKRGGVNIENLQSVAIQNSIPLPDLMEAVAAYLQAEKEVMGGRNMSRLG